MTKEGMWVIGYGSLIFKPPPFVAHKVSGTIEGYVRRFWQSSSDHRGTPESPGRVATLVSLEDLKSHKPFGGSIQTYDIEDIAGSKLRLKESVEKVADLASEDLKVWGVAYYINPENVDQVKEYLDIREQDGYTLHTIKFCVESGVEGNGKVQELLADLPKDEENKVYIQSNVYIGAIDNPSFVGPESIEATAEIIKKSRGPSGDNFSYLRELTAALRDLHPDSSSTDWYLETLTFLSVPK